VNPDDDGVWYVRYVVDGVELRGGPFKTDEDARAWKRVAKTFPGVKDVEVICEIRKTIWRV